MGSKAGRQGGRQAGRQVEAQWETQWETSFQGPSFQLCLPLRLPACPALSRSVHRPPLWLPPCFNCVSHLIFRNLGTLESPTLFSLCLLPCLQLCPPPSAPLPNSRTMLGFSPSLLLCFPLCLPPATLSLVCNVFSHLALWKRGGISTSPPSRMHVDGCGRVPGSSSCRLLVLHLCNSCLPDVSQLFPNCVP